MPILSFKNSLLILLLVLLISACKKTEPNLTPPSYESFSSFQLVWRTALSDSSNHSDKISSINLLMNSDGDILTSDKYNHGTVSEAYKLYDGTTGKLKWSWNEHLKTLEYLFQFQPLKVNDALVFCGHNTMYSIDLISGKTIWNQLTDTMYGGEELFKDEDGYIYYEYPTQAGAFTTFHVVRTYYNQLNWESIYSFTDSTNRKGYTKAIAFSKNNLGEKLLLYSRDIEYRYNYTKNRICCYNLTTKNTEWIKEYSDRMCDRMPPSTQFTNEGRLFKVWSTTDGSEDYFLAAISIQDGSIIWEKKLPNWCYCFPYKDKIVCDGAYQNPIQCFNQSTGVDAWKVIFSDYYINLMNPIQDNPVVFKNYLFSTIRSDLLVINLDNGTNYIYKDVALPGWSIDVAVSVNETKRLIYVKDAFNLNCFKLPKEIIF